MPIDHDIERQLGDYGRWLEGALGTTLTPPTAVAPERRHTAKWLYALAAVGLVVTAVLVWQRHNTKSIRSATTTAPTTPNTDAVAPPLALTWEQFEPEGTMAKSGVNGVVAGPNGFVAVGMGLESSTTFPFDGLRNVGRVWHSTDGVRWTEPAMAMFDALGVVSVAATADAFWVLAGPNTDRADAPDVPTQLYRSTDGETWAPVGAPSVPLGGGVFATGDRLFSVTEPTEYPTSQPDGSWTGTYAGMHVITSTDGVTWSDAVGLPDQTSFVRVLHLGERYYGWSELGDGGGVWSSTDGLSWQALPEPPEGAMIDLGGRVAVLADPADVACHQQSSGGLPDQYEEYIAALWACTGQVQLYSFDEASDTWSPLTTSGLEPRPGWPATITFGTTPLMWQSRSDHTFEVLSSDDGGATWSAPLFTGTSGDQQPGTPSAAATDSIVVFIGNEGLGSPVSVVVGS